MQVYGKIMHVQVNFFHSLLIELFLFHNPLHQQPTRFNVYKNNILGSTQQFILKIRSTNKANAVSEY